MERFCRDCGNPLKEKSKFCPGCGRAIEQPEPQTPKCAYCGAQLKATSKFCPKCGKTVVAAEQAPPFKAAQPIYAPQQPRASVPVQQTAQRFAGQAVRSTVNQTAQPAQQAVQQAAQNVVGQASRPIGQVMSNLGGMANSINASPNSGSFAVNLPNIVSTTVSTAKSGVDPIPLIAGLASGGLSALLLYQLPSPWPVIIGFLVSGLTLAVRFIFKKRRGGNRK
jgi:RNA polymerase subunit RPABC4/transcription elongation factor Spt4